MAHPRRAQHRGPLAEPARRLGGPQRRRVGRARSRRGCARLPFLVELEDGTLAQHTDDDRYAEIGDTVEAVNAAVRAWLATRGGAFQSLRYTIGRHGFDDPERLQRYLDALRRRRVVHGHTPHWDDVPISFHGGLAVGYDGRFSRFWGRAEGEEPGPIGATVALLPPLPDAVTGAG